LRDSDQLSVEKVNAILLKIFRELHAVSQEMGINVSLAGGFAIHILRASIGNEPINWKHKDIDVVLPLVDVSRFIGLLKSFGYVRSHLSPKDKGRYIYQNLICGLKVSIDVTGKSSLTSLKLNYKEHEYEILSPDELLENAREKWSSLDKNPKVGRSVDFLENYLKLHAQEKGGYT